MENIITVKRRGQIIGYIQWNGDASYSATALNPKTGETKCLGVFGKQNAGGMISENYNNAMNAVKKFKW
jgi:hypothetical protein